MYKYTVYAFVIAASAIFSLSSDSVNTPGREFSRKKLIAAGGRGGPLTPVSGEWSDDDNLSFGTAMADWNDHHYDGAMAKLRKHLQDYPKSPWAAEAELHVGCYSYYKGDYHMAEKTFKQLLQKHPDGQIARKALIRLGVLYADSARYDEAFDCFKKCDEARPTWQQRTFCRSWLMRVHSLRMLGGRAENCGALALKRVLELKGLPVSEESPGGECSTFSEIARLAEKFGIQAGGAKLNYGDLTSLSDPAIVHIEPPHFLVVERADSRNVFAFDPHGGRRIMSRERFLHTWDGCALLFGQPEIAVSDILTEEEMKKIKGGCCGTPLIAGELGQTADDIRVGCSSGRVGYPTNPGQPGLAATGGFGSPMAYINPKTLNIIIRDTPIGYHPARGPSVAFTITYNSTDPQDATGGAGGHNYYPFGNKWSSNLNSFYLLDPSGNVTVVMPDGRRDLYTRNAPPNERTFTPPLRIYHKLIENSDGSFTLTLKRTKLKYNYSPSHQSLSSIEDRWGNTVTLNRDAAGNLLSVVDAAGRETTVTSDLNGRISCIKDPIGRTAHFIYSEAGDLVSVTDMGGYTYSYSYDPDKYILTLGRPTGTSIFTHTFPDHIEEWPPVTHTWETYKIAVTDAKNRTETFYWKGHAYGPTEVADRNGNVTRFFFNWKAAGPVLDYVSKGELGLFEAEGWRLFHYEYDDELNRTMFREAAVKNCLARDGSCPYRDTVYTYSNGNITSRTDPGGHKTSYGWDANDNLVSITDPLSRTTTFAYDSAGNLTSSIPPHPFDDNTTDYTYTQHGKIETITNSRGYTTVFNYDSLDRLTDLYFPDGTSVSLAYDAVDRPIAVSYPTGLTLNCDYDNLDRPSRIDYPDGTYREYHYRCCGMTSARDRAGRVTHFDYDELSRLVLVTDPAGNLTEYTYDPIGNIIKVQAARDGSLQPVVEYDYATPSDDPDNQENHLNHLAAIIFPGERRRQFNHLWTGEIKKATLESGESTECVYDAGGRITQAFSGLWGISYDYNSNDEVTAITHDFPEDAWVTTYSYDELGRIVSVDCPDTNDAVHYTYDAAGNRASMTVSGIRTSYSYDPMNRLEAVASPYASASYRYLNGLLDAISYSNGDTAKYDYDPRDRLTSLISKNSAQSVLAAYTYSYGIPETITDITDNGGFADSFRYDNLYRLTRETRGYPNGAIHGMNRFGYDEMGNRKRYSGNGKVTASTFAQDNRLISSETGALLDVVGRVKTGDWQVAVSGTPATVESDGTFIAEGLDLPVGPNTVTAEGYNPSTGENASDSINITKLPPENATYTYDARGNMTSRTDSVGTTAYKWDPFNRLTSVSLPDGTGNRYFYDGMGRRLRSVENGVERRFVYDGWNVIGEKRSGSNGLVSYYTRGLDPGGGIGGIISVHRNGTPEIYPGGFHTGDYFYHYNHRGDVVSVTNSSGSEVAHYRYDAFGKPVEKTGAFDSPYQFSTKEYDAASGLSYYGFRYYSPEQGAWLSQDPLGYINGLNLYSFVSNNPANWIDPWGLWSIDIGVSGGYWAGGAAGIILGPKGIYSYTGGGAVTPGVGASATWSLSNPTPGWNISIQGGYWAGFQYNYAFRKPRGGSLAIGLVTPGFSVIGYNVEKLWNWPWIEANGRYLCN